MVNHSLRRFFIILENEYKIELERDNNVLCGVPAFVLSFQFNFLFVFFPDLIKNLLRERENKSRLATQHAVKIIQRTLFSKRRQRYDCLAIMVGYPC